MKRLIFISFFFLFLMSPFFQGEMSRFNRDRGVLTGFIFAQTPTIPSVVSPAVSSESSWWTQFWNWISGIFIKTDYAIAERSLNDINSDMTTYGEASDSAKHASSGSRLTDTHSQTCYKGNVIKKVILNESGYPNTDLSYLCPASGSCSVKTLDSVDTSGCQKISIKDLAHYFVQINKQFYCDDTNKLIDIESNVIDAVNTFVTDGSLPEIPSFELPCYQKIYQDFYLVPKDTTDQNEENSKNIVQTPISVSDQDSSGSANVKALKKQLNQNFTPDGTSWSGLNSLRPASSSANGW